MSFESVPAFLFARDQEVELPGVGAIKFDIAYGGAFYALADCRQFGLEFGRNRVRDFVDAATALTERLKAEFPLSHPDHADLAFLYGTILTDGKDAFCGEATKNICVFAEAEVDRSPTGSGVTARLAAMHAKGEIDIGQTRTFESIAGSRFSGAVARTAKAGPHDAIIAQRRRPRLLQRPDRIHRRGRRRAGARVSAAVSQRCPSSGCRHLLPVNDGEKGTCRGPWRPAGR